MNTGLNTKTIICYGDSNTWGYDPQKDNRYPAHIRWPGVLQDILGSSYEVVSEGLCGRTLVTEDPKKPYRTGITHLTSIIQTHEPLDIFIVMLGTNDIKSTYGLSVHEIADHLRQTIRLVRTEALNKDQNPAAILIICPPSVTIPTQQNLDERMKLAPEIWPELPPLYEKVAHEFDCLFLDAGNLMSLENTDGYHLAAEHHKILGEAVAKIIQSI